MSTRRIARVEPAQAVTGDAPPNLGVRIRQLRTEMHWSLNTLSVRTGIASSTLSKVENGTLSLTYDRLLMVANGFGLTLSEFLAPSDGSAATIQGMARISWAKAGSGSHIVTGAYDYNYLCTNLRHKRMVPILTEVRARTLGEFGPMLRHEGEEFTLTIEGRVEVHTEFYAPEILEVGEGVYIDSRQGHAYLNASDGVSKIISINSGGMNEFLVRS